MLSTRNLTLFYFLILAVEIVADMLHIRPLVMATKSLLMPLLLYIGWKHHAPNWLLLALFFGWLGDVFLLFDASWAFMVGLGNFLIGHVFYILLFSKEAKTHWVVRFGYAFFTAGFYFIFLKDKLDAALQLPVVLYLLVITVMAIRATERVTPSVTSYRFVTYGAALFVLSDALLAFDKFVEPLPLRTLLVMGTYGLAQYLILQGILHGRKSLEA